MSKIEEKVDGFNTNKYIKNVMLQAIDAN